MNGSSSNKYVENSTQNEKVLASKSTHITQITVVECGDLFKTYEVRARGIYGLGFTETYKQKYQAFATFNLMCATLRLTGLELN